MSTRRGGGRVINPPINQPISPRTFVARMLPDMKRTLRKYEQLTGLIERAGNFLLEEPYRSDPVVCEFWRVGLASARSYTRILPPEKRDQFRRRRTP